MHIDAYALDPILQGAEVDFGGEGEGPHYEETGFFVDGGLRGHKVRGDVSGDGIRIFKM